MLNNVRPGTNGEDSAWDTRPSTDSWRPRGENGYRDNEPEYQIPPPEKGTGYGVGVGSPTHAGPSKKASVDQAYLEHPSKADEAALPLADAKLGSQNDKVYDPYGAPPSYHGHDSEYPHHGAFLPYTSHARTTTNQPVDPGSPISPTWQQQAFNPYAPPPPPSKV
jgi:hypothetical protein